MCACTDGMRAHSYPSLQLSKFVEIIQKLAEVVNEAKDYILLEASAKQFLPHCQDKM